MKIDGASSSIGKHRLPCPMASIPVEAENERELE